VSLPGTAERERSQVAVPVFGATVSALIHALELAGFDRIGRQSLVAYGARISRPLVDHDRARHHRPARAQADADAQQIGITRREQTHLAVETVRNEVPVFARPVLQRAHEGLTLAIFPIQRVEDGVEQRVRSRVERPATLAILDDAI